MCSRRKIGFVVLKFISDVIICLICIFFGTDPVTSEKYYFKCDAADLLQD